AQSVNRFTRLSEAQHSARGYPSAPVAGSVHLGPLSPHSAPLPERRRPTDVLETGMGAQLSHRPAKPRPGAPDHRTGSPGDRFGGDLDLDPVGLRGAPRRPRPPPGGRP